jgi:hypothetical protein
MKDESATSRKPSMGLIAPPPLKRQPRLKPISTEADVAAVPWFDDEDRAVCLDTLLRSIKLYDAQPTIVVRTAVNDPKGARAKFEYGAELNKLLGNEGMNRHTVQGSILNLLVVMTLQHTNDECLAPAIIAGNGKAVPGFKPHHYALMRFPDSEVWSDEQRLILRYTRAVLDNTMTDALWTEAVKFWGPQTCLRFVHLIGHFWTTGIRNRTLKVPYDLKKG